jgi:hypothetical protein
MHIFSQPVIDGADAMDLKSLREEAIAETARVFWDTRGFVPDEESEEWEAEYRRQFELAKRRHAEKAARPAAAAAAPASAETRRIALPELTGAPAEQRWAATLRSDRLKELSSPELREWVAASWTTAKSWIDTRDRPAASFLRQVEAQYAEHRRKMEAEAVAAAAARQAEAAAAGSVHQQVRQAGITAQGLIDLVDVSARIAAAPIRDKLAELAAGGRTLRVFETTDPGVLMVLEKSDAGRADYAIERDDGLVADLKLFARSLAIP